MMKKIGILICISFFANFVLGQDIAYVDKKYDTEIGAVTFHYAGQYLSYPILGLNSNEQLQLTFDDFTAGLRYFSYKVILCNKDWTPSDVPVLNYLDGYETNEIENNNLSFNTRAKYTSHTLNIPNENLKLKLSGNYILYVWDDDTDEPVLTRRFIIVEDRVLINKRLVAPDFVDKRRTHQEIKFSVSNNNYPISNPEREISATILQNGRWTDAMTNIEPRFSRADIIDFEYLGEIIFPGGREFRIVDTRSLTFTDPEIHSIEYYTDGYGVRMQPDVPRLGFPHQSYIDLNGQFTIINSDDFGTARRTNANIDSTSNIVDQLNSLQGNERDRLINNALRSDYCTVEFFLDKSYELVNKDVYVIGAFNGWQLNDENKMKYKDGAYFCAIELKQGLTDYLYVTTAAGKKTIDLTEIEGSSFETRNEYTILIYQRGPMDRHDRIIGMNIFKAFN